MRSPAFATVILDVDSTVSGVEGIDWLAARRGADVAKQVATLTDRAMRGEVRLEDVYGARLALVRPDRAAVEALGREYIGRMAPGCEVAIARMRAHGVDVKLVSGGIRAAIESLAARLGLLRDDLFAVDVTLDDEGNYASFDERSALTTAEGKKTVVESMRLARPAIAVGDGSTDLAVRSAVDRFVCFTGFTRRDAVARQADAEIATFDELLRMVLPDAPAHHPGF